MVYAYLRNQFKQTGNGFIQLILMHILCFLFLVLFNTGCYICGCQEHSSWLYRQLTLPSLYPLLLERPWTIMSYSFIHNGLIDLFWDMCILYVFGKRIRAITRSKHILRLYCLGQIVGATVFLMLYQFSPPFRGVTTDLSGPSAAIYAIMAAVCVLMPSVRLYCFFFSLPLRYVAFALLVIALMHLCTQHAGYYLAQLGGALAGYVYARLCKNDWDINHSFFSLHSVKRTKMSVSVTKKIIKILCKLLGMACIMEIIREKLSMLGCTLRYNLKAKAKKITGTLLLVALAFILLSLGVYFLLLGWGYWLNTVFSSAYLGFLLVSIFCFCMVTLIVLMLRSTINNQKENIDSF